MAWKVAKVINVGHLDEEEGYNYYLQVSRKLFRSEVFFLRSYDYVSQEGEPTEEGRKLLEDYVLGPLVSKFSLTPGLPLLAAYKKEDSARKIKERMTSCFYQYGGLISSNGRDFTITPSALFGEGFIVFLKKGNYVTVDCIIYTPRSHHDGFRLHSGLSKLLQGRPKDRGTGVVYNSGYNLGRS